MPRVSISETVHSASLQLACAGVEEPLLNVRVLLGHALGIKPDSLRNHMDRALTEAEATLIASLVERRSKRETLNRIIGRGEFCGLWFELNEATLEPRPESEIIVRAILEKLGKPVWKSRIKKPLRILDLGTGSGCIMLSLLHNLPNATGLAIDIAPRAIKKAEENARRLGLNRRCAFRLNNWASGISEAFDILSFNPPYIPRSDIPKLQPAVRNYDPILALEGGEDGLDPYRTVIPSLPRLLKSGGFAGIELGDGQTNEVGRMLKQSGFTDISLYADFRGFERVFVVRKT
ncbi:MAG: peptide chain release factor N(5)-glutamine methyltransferase [Alphaproteobacteria bacterium]|nr:peptide chain release factor N(5)-glutamine methyltransferase [Alphaproteobacteria bacterium]